MQEVAGVAASVGFASLGLLALFSWFVHLSGFGPLVLQTVTEAQIERTMRKGTRVEQAIADAQYDRADRSAEDVSEYADMLVELGLIEVGEPNFARSKKFTVEFPTVTYPVDVKNKAGEIVGTENETYIEPDESEGENPEWITIRAFKRRMNLAAKSLGWDEFRWRQPQGRILGRIIQTVEERAAKEAAAKEAAEKAAAEAQAEADAAEGASEDEVEDEEEDEPTTGSVASEPVRPRPAPPQSQRPVQQPIRRPTPPPVRRNRPGR